MNKNLENITHVYHTNIRQCWVDVQRLHSNLCSLPEPIMIQKAAEALRCVEEIQALIELRFEGQVPDEEDEIPF